VVLRLPQDRPNTTMKNWPLDDYCSAEYSDPRNRRFHAQPVACPSCGPNYFLYSNQKPESGGAESIRAAVQLLKEGWILAVKGLDGYHLACNAFNSTAVQALRDRKYRKEKPFALMARNLEVARDMVQLPPEAEQLLISKARSR
jgi:hydrogenase maturation protein HypF